MAKVVTTGSELDVDLEILDLGGDAGDDVYGEAAGGGVAADNWLVWVVQAGSCRTAKRRPLATQERGRGILQMLTEYEIFSRFRLISVSNPTAIDTSAGEAEAVSDFLRPEQHPLSSPSRPSLVTKLNDLKRGMNSNR